MTQKSKAKPSSMMLQYVLIIFLVLLVVIGLIKISNLFYRMVTPESTGFLLSNEDFYSVRSQRLIWIILIILASLPILFILVIRGNIAGFLKNILTALWTISLMALFAEGVLMYYSKSDSIGFPLSHYLWTRQHWISYTPYFDDRIPPMKLRGREDYSWINKGKNKVFIIGDSFCAGDGVREDKIFSNIVSNKMKTYSIVNICEKGADVQRVKENLMTFLSRGMWPDVLVWQYYGNDVETYAQVSNIVPNYSPPSWLEQLGSDYLDRKSFLTDFLYWHFIRPDHSLEYTSFLTKAYNDTKVVSAHLYPIYEVINLCKQKNVPIIFIVFPFLQDIPLSEELYASNLTAFLQNNGVTVINMCNHLKRLPIKDRVVHNSNPHPSEKIHTITAEKLLEELNRLIK